MTIKVAMSCGVVACLMVCCMGQGCLNVVGGPCEYDVVEGSATIDSVDAALVQDGDCTNDPVVVTFTFMPDGGTTGDEITGLTLTISSGLNPPRTWVESEGLTAGTVHRCEQQTITSGTCTPIIYEFTGVNYQNAIEACY